MALLLFFLRTERPRNPIKSIFKQIDWFGNAVLIPSVISVLLALEFGGTKQPWSSWRTLLPLILGILGLIGFCILQASISPRSQRYARPSFLQPRFCSNLWPLILSGHARLLDLVLSAGILPGIARTNPDPIRYIHPPYRSHVHALRHRRWLGSLPLSTVPPISLNWYNLNHNLIRTLLEAGYQLHERLLGRRAEYWGSGYWGARH
jgi:hypothetical protein